MTNILLIGMPGSGKTAIGREVAKKMKKPFVDIDELILVLTGKDSAEHLKKLGDEKFLDFESKIAQKIKIKNGVIAASGSVPLRKIGIEHLKKDAITIWMDIPLNIIEARVKKRSDGDSRIVGAEKMTFNEILEWRKKTYQENHNIYFTLEEEKPKLEVVEMLLSLLRKNGIV